MTTQHTGVEGPTVEYSQDRASFRWILYYDIATDSIACRLDVKVGNKQLGKMFHKISPPESAQRITPEDPLIAPKGGVIAAEVMLVDRLTLAKALHGLASHLESAR